MGALFVLNLEARFHFLMSFLVSHEAESFLTELALKWLLHSMHLDVVLHVAQFVNFEGAPPAVDHLVLPLCLGVDRPHHLVQLLWSALLYLHGGL